METFLTKAISFSAFEKAVASSAAKSSHCHVANIHSIACTNLAFLSCENKERLERIMCKVVQKPKAARLSHSANTLRRQDRLKE